MKPLRPWLAFLLNLFLPPTGYVYAGYARTATAFITAIIAMVVLAMALTVRFPPGLYAYPTASGAPLVLWTFATVLNLIAGVHAAWLARRNTRRFSGRKLWAIAVSLWILPLALSGLARAYAPVSVYNAASAAMNPSLAQGDTVAVRGARSVCDGADVAPGEVIIHRRDHDPNRTRWMKRVVAVGGQRVQMRDGRLFIDGKPVKIADTGRTFRTEWGRAASIFRETLPNGTSYTIMDMGPDGELDNTAEIAVPAESVFVLGDNRDNSLDSRTEGPVPLRDICGVAFKVLYAKDGARIGARP